MDIKKKKLQQNVKQDQIFNKETYAMPFSRSVLNLFVDITTRASMWQKNLQNEKKVSQTKHSVERIQQNHFIIIDVFTDKKRSLLQPCNDIFVFWSPKQQFLWGLTPILF